MKEKLLTSLNGVWRLTLAQNEEVIKSGFAPKNVKELNNCGYLQLDAKVPGNFELDLFAAGLAPDPYFAQNPFEYQQYENRHLWYSLTFDSEMQGDENTFLRFDGIDTVSDVFLNGKLLGRTENMFLSYEFNVCDLKKQGNELVVHIYPAAIYARKYELKPMHNAHLYLYNSLPIRKAPSMYGWDIMPRFVSGGIWKGVALVQKQAERIEQFYLYTTETDSQKQSAKLNAFFEVHTPKDDIRNLKITFEGKCGDSSFYSEQQLWHTFGNMRAFVENAKLWYPKNAGEHPLYDVRVRLWRDGTICDEKEFQFGIRTIALERTSTTDKSGDGEFVFRVNGKKVFCVGTNWVPLDAFHSQDIKRLPQALSLLDELGCNIVRCWGGNVYENDGFFDFCDSHGIMVWQDFAMACATYPQDNRFAEKLYEEASFVIKRLRNHASLALWAGDNEVDLLYGWNGVNRDPNFNRLTREVLAGAVREYDVVRPYLPSSPFVDEEAFRTGMPTSEDHLWGPRDYFKGDYYQNTVCHFASETGYHGCPSPKSLAKFISREQLWPIFDENKKFFSRDKSWSVFDGKSYPKGDWICHSSCMELGPSVDFDYRVLLMTSQVVTMFGKMPDDLDTYARQSQISQAEAKKYFIERFRISKWRRTGIIWWNLIDGWPQVSDAVVDYYGCKKLAFGYIKRSQQSLCLMFDEPKDDMLALFAVNDLQKDVKISYIVKNLVDDSVVARGETVAVADSSVRIDSVKNIESFTILYIEWKTEDGVIGRNHFATKTKGIDYRLYLNCLKKTGFDSFEGF